MQEARKNQGALAFSLSIRQQIEANQAFELIRPYEVSLPEVIGYYLKHAQPRGGRKLANEVVAEFLAAKTKAGKKPRYIKELTCKLDNFKEKFGTRYLNELTRSEIEEWLTSQNFSPITYTNYLRDLGILFRWAVEARSYCEENIVEKIEKPQIPPAETEIFEVTEALQLLFAAHISPDLQVLPYLAIGFFAGLRSSELESLTWENIDWRQRVIEVTAASSKTSQNRHVHISDNLAAWLEPHLKPEGLITPRNLYRRIGKVLELAEIEKWPQNGLRHSFGTYHFAFHKNANLTANELGHCSTKMLFKHYRRLVKPEEATEYWHIFPPKGWAMLPPSEHIKRVKAQKPEQKLKALKLLNDLIAAELSSQKDEEESIAQA